MGRNNILDIEKEYEKRKMIYDYISKYPGLHNREISRKLSILLWAQILVKVSASRNKPAI